MDRTLRRHIRLFLSGHDGVLTKFLVAVSFIAVVSFCAVLALRAWALLPTSSLKWLLPPIQTTYGSLLLAVFQEAKLL